jgi:hypothetical protein
MPHFKEFEKIFPELIEGPESVVAYEVSGESVIA